MSVDYVDLTQQPVPHDLNDLAAVIKAWSKEWLLLGGHNARTGFHEITGDSTDAYLISQSQTTNRQLEWIMFPSILTLDAGSPRINTIIPMGVTGDSASTQSINVTDRLHDPNYRVVVSRVKELVEVDEEDPDSPKPTKYAYDNALYLLSKAALLMNKRFPRASTGVDVEGGIRIYWRSPERNVHLAIPAHKGGRSFIYHSEGSEYKLDNDVAAKKLASWLDWFSRE